jgi:hypothetical protein
LGDIFSGASAKLNKKKGGKTGGKIVPSNAGNEPIGLKKVRRVFPPLQDWMVDHNLKQYTQILRTAGFKETKTLLLMKDVDMTQLGFKTGHKRKLQAAIKRLREVGEPQSQGAIAKRKRRAAKKFASKYAV